MLHRVAAAALPMTFRLAEEIEELLSLRDAGYLRMDLEPPTQRDQWPAVTVTAITPLGHMALRDLDSTHLPE